MADTVIAASLTVDGSQATQQVQQVNQQLTQTGETVKSFKQQLREAKAELLSAVQAYGEFSEQASVAAAKLGELKNQQRDAASLAANFAVDGSASLAAFGGAIRGVTGGFAALTGAASLFGNKNKDVEESLLKIQSYCSAYHSSCKSIALLELRTLVEMSRIKKLL